MAIPIIFIHKGDSFYLKYALENARKFNPNSRIILVGDNVTQYPSFVEYYDLKNYDKSALEFKKVYKHMSNNNEEIERFCFERWFILNEFLKKNKIKKCLTLDSDVLIFVNVTNDSKKFNKFKFTLANHSSGEFMFVNDYKEINKLTRFLFNLYSNKKMFMILDNFWKNYPFKTSFGGVNDMTALSEYYKQNKKKIGEISKIINGETYDTQINASQGMIMENNTKKIIFENGIPFGFLKKNNKKIKLCCLHCAGPTKFYMKYYSKGRNINFLEKLKINFLMNFRDNYSQLLNNKQRIFLKKVLIKFGF
ncbi:MAG: hypothetical protein PHP82_00020 [Candidatus ainarchaeum sp.]|nr:hypothetical protein [Candidatus ainarchaeum sp.]